MRERLAFGRQERRGDDMTKDEIRDGMFGIVRSVLAQEALALSPETTARDVAGWDSLKQVKIILKVEDTFGIRFSSREIGGLRNVGDFVALIGAKTGPAP
jgi:acyl carrier protein